MIFATIFKFGQYILENDNNNNNNNTFWVHKNSIKISNNFNRVGLYILHRWIHIVIRDLSICEQGIA